MAKKSSYLIGGLAIAAVMIGALPAAQGIGATKKEPPIFRSTAAPRATGWPRRAPSR